MIKQNKDYAKHIDALVDKYEEGREILILPDDWKYTPRIKPQYKDTGLSETWLGVVADIHGIQAHEKYGLDTYENKIEVITSARMIDAYTSVGMPVNYTHWSFGLESIKQSKKYQAGQMGLAYEIVINSDPCVSYCMEENTKMMMNLVIAHAAYGHNSFFKGNHLFRQFTDSKTIINDMTVFAERVDRYRGLYGEEEVEAVLDACHALMNYGVDRRTRPIPRSAEEDRARREEAERFRQFHHNPLFAAAAAAAAPKNSELSRSFYEACNPLEEENILRYIAENAPLLQDWERDIVRGVSKIAQYFFPQRQTQVMNEGWATFWHYTLMNDLYWEHKLIDTKMFTEFIQSHTNVTHQPSYNEKWYNGINPYALGFAMHSDIRRICEKPTEEDRRYFPEFAGDPNWVSVLDTAMRNYKDESFIHQFLSPKVMRDFRLFHINDDDKEATLRVGAIHNEDGFEMVRAKLAAQYDLGNREPRIEVGHFNKSTDRNLFLFHTMNNRRPVNDQTEEVLKHLYMLWSGRGDPSGGHRVILHSVDPAGKHVGTISCPPMPKGSDPKTSYPLRP